MREVDLINVAGRDVFLCAADFRAKRCCGCRRVKFGSRASDRTRWGSGGGEGLEEIAQFVPALICVSENQRAVVNAKTKSAIVADVTGRESVRQTVIDIVVPVVVLLRGDDLPQCMTERGPVA